MYYLESLTLDAKIRVSTIRMTEFLSSVCQNFGYIRVGIQWYTKRPESTFFFVMRC